MGMRESLKNIESAIEDMEGAEKRQPKAKPPKQGKEEDERMERLEGSMRKLELAVEDIRKNAQSRGSHERDYSKDIEKIRNEIESMRSESGTKTSAAGDAESIRKSVDDIRGEISRKIDALSRSYDEKIRSMEKAGSEAAQGDAKRGIFGIRLGAESGAGDIAKKLDEIRNAAKGDRETARKSMEELEKRLNARLESASSGIAHKNDIDSLKKYIDEIRSAAGKKLEDTSKANEESFRNMEKRFSQIGSKADESVLNSLKGSVQHSVFGFKSGVDRHINDAVRKIDETAAKLKSDQENLKKEMNEKLNAISDRLEDKAKNAPSEKNILEIKSRMDVLQKYVEGKLETVGKSMNGDRSTMQQAKGGADAEMKKSIDEIRNVSKNEAESMRKAMEELSKSCQEKISGAKAELEARIGELNKAAAGDGETRKYISSLESKIAESSRKADKIGNDMANAMNAIEKARKKESAGNSENGGFITKTDFEKYTLSFNDRLSRLSEKIDSVSKVDMDRLGSLANAERRMDENLKIFALNSDVEKIWKEAEGLRKYIDERTRAAADLSNSLRVWETRNMQVMEKERALDERLNAFPELKLIDGRMRKLERAILDLQKHFVAAQITEPIIIE